MACGVLVKFVTLLCRVLCLTNFIVAFMLNEICHCFVGACAWQNLLAVVLNFKA